MGYLRQSLNSLLLRTEFCKIRCCIVLDGWLIISFIATTICGTTSGNSSSRLVARYLRNAVYRHAVQITHIINAKSDDGVATRHLRTKNRTRVVLMTGCR